MNLLADIANVGKAVSGALGVHPGGSQQTAPSNPPRPGNTPQPGYSPATGGVPQGTQIQQPNQGAGQVASLLGHLQALQALQVQQQHAPLNLGVPYGSMQQGNAYNPGYSPMQATHSFVPPLHGLPMYNPQPGQQVVNPQMSPTQQLWQQ
ncbi:MAG TPA: hypothetical protein VH234_04570 [Candidatus Saccharimonadales bacterium]|nr:hypothetical protein [Candidatus Saccharimonadales bacterium]